VETSKVDIPESENAIDQFLRQPLAYPEPPECIHYDECLSKAAHLNGPLVCDHCLRFQKRPDGKENVLPEYTPNQFIHCVSLYRGFYEDDPDYVIVFEIAGRPEKGSDDYLPFMDLLGRLEPGFIGGLQREKLNDALSHILPGTWMPWVVIDGEQLPGELVDITTRQVLYKKAPSTILDKKPKKLRPNQEAKKECQRIGKDIWAKYPVLDIVQVARHRDIKAASNMFTLKTRSNWLKEIAPENVKRGGRRDKTTRLEQDRACKALGIK